MATAKEERDRILELVEGGQVSAAEAGQLLDALEDDVPVVPAQTRERMVRITARNSGARGGKVNLVATIPLRLLKIMVQLGGFSLPQLSKRSAEDLLRSIEGGSTGRLLDLHDLEQGYHLEVFVE